MAKWRQDGWRPGICCYLSRCLSVPKLPLASPFFGGGRPRTTPQSGCFQCLLCRPGGVRRCVSAPTLLYIVAIKGLAYWAPPAETRRGLHAQSQSSSILCIPFSLLPFIRADSKPPPLVFPVPCEPPPRISGQCAVPLPPRTVEQLQLLPCMVRLGRGAQSPLPELRKPVLGPTSIGVIRFRAASPPPLPWQRRVGE